MPKVGPNTTINTASTWPWPTADGRKSCGRSATWSWTPRPARWTQTTWMRSSSRNVSTRRTFRIRTSSSDERGGAHLELLAVATRLLGVVLRRRLLARLPEDRLPPSPSIVPDAPTTIWRIGVTGALKSRRQVERPHEGRGRLLPPLRRGCVGGPGRDPEDDRHALPLGPVPNREGRAPVRPIRTAAACLRRRAETRDEPRTAHRLDRGETLRSRSARGRRASPLPSGRPPRPAPLCEPEDQGRRSRGEPGRLLRPSRRANHRRPGSVPPRRLRDEGRPGTLHGALHLGQRNAGPRIHHNLATGGHRPPRARPATRGDQRRGGRRHVAELVLLLPGRPRRPRMGCGAHRRAKRDVRGHVDRLRAGEPSVA